MAFHETDLIKDPVSGRFVGSDTSLLGLLSAKEVYKEFTKGHLLKKLSKKGIKIGDKVITK